MIGQLGKTLLIVGLGFILLGLVFMASHKVPWLGHLPGDISIHRKNFHVYFPLATSILVSILLTLLLNIFRR